MIFNLFKKDRKQEELADQLYQQLVNQARLPVFYTDYAIPDTINGRFEMLLLHSYMLFHRLRKEDEEATDLGQAVFDRFFKDMDHSLREIGIGDLSVPKKIKKMAQAFYGRVDAYDKAKEQGDDDVLNALARNFFPEEEDMPAQIKDLADYMAQAEKALDDMQIETIKAGSLTFPQPKPLSQ